MTMDLLEFEDKYLEDLVVVQGMYAGTFDMIGSEENKEILFGFMDDLEKQHRSLLKDLADVTPGCRLKSFRLFARPFAMPKFKSNDSSIDSLDEPTMIGEVFLAHHEALESVYRNFIEGYEERLSLLNRLRPLNAFKVWAEECGKIANIATGDPRIIGDLGDWFTRVALRLTKYHMILEAIFKLTPSNHADFVNLRLALSAMKSAMAKMPAFNPGDHDLGSKARRSLP